MSWTRSLRCWIVAFDRFARTVLSIQRNLEPSFNKYSLEYSQIASHEVEPRQTVSIASFVRLGLTLPVIRSRVDVAAP